MLMDLNDFVYFDGDNLITNKVTKVIYKGKLCANEPKELYMHYLLWHEMGKSSRNQAS